MVTRNLAGLALLAITGVGCADDGGATRVTLSARFDQYDGFHLATATTIEIPNDGSGRVDLGASDFYMVAGMEVSLHGARDEGLFCDKGPDHDGIAAIDAATEGCAWEHARLGANTANATYVFPGHGYLVRDLDHVQVYRLFVVDNRVDPGSDGAAWVTFDLLAVD